MRRVRWAVGPGIELEGQVHTPHGAAAGLAVLAHRRYRAHTAYGYVGGTQDDPVVQTLAAILVSYGIAVATYNARGVGTSGGRVSWTMRAESEDYQAIVDQMQELIVPSTDSPHVVLGVRACTDAGVQCRCACVRAMANKCVCGYLPVRRCVAERRTTLPARCLPPRRTVGADVWKRRVLCRYMEGACRRSRTAARLRAARHHDARPVHAALGTRTHLPVLPCLARPVCIDALRPRRLPRRRPLFPITQGRASASDLRRRLVH